MSTIDLEKRKRTPAQLAVLEMRYREQRDQAEALDIEIKDLEEAMTVFTKDMQDIQTEVSMAQEAEDPAICEPHGELSVTERGQIMNAGGLIHIKDGKGCYARSIGRLSDFSEKELEIYRDMRKRLK